MTLLIVLLALSVLVPLAWWVARLGASGSGRTRPPVVPSTEAGVRLLLEAGDTIAAIKLYRELTGVGLKEAKDAVDALAAGQSLPPSSPAPRQLADAGSDPEIQRLLDSGQAIAAIKRYRELTGMGLKEAKDAIDRLAR